MKIVSFPTFLLCICIIAEILVKKIKKVSEKINKYDKKGIK